MNRRMTFQLKFEALKTATKNLHGLFADIDRLRAWINTSFRKLKTSKDKESKVKIIEDIFFDVEEIPSRAKISFGRS